MVRKFVILKTNKEAESDEYPGYGLHFTDFSPNRKSPLSREVRVSNSREQIESLCDQFMQAQIKKGWELETSSIQQTRPVVAQRENSPAVTEKVVKEPAAAGKQDVKDAPVKTTQKTGDKKPVTKKVAASERTRRKSRKKFG